MSLTDPKKKAELLKLLERAADCEMASVSEMVNAHIKAEELLLSLLGDEDIANAWDDASEQWWYS